VPAPGAAPVLTPAHFRPELYATLISPSSPAPASAFLALVRHARALPATPGQADSQRELSGAGRAEFQLQLARLEAMRFGCDKLWTSPWRRARETSQMLGGVCKREPEDHEGLCSDPSSPEGIELIAQASEQALASRVVLVGHQPWLAQIARGLGVLDVRDIECGEVIWLQRRPVRGWVTAARLYPG